LNVHLHQNPPVTRQFAFLGSGYYPNDELNAWIGPMHKDGTLHGNRYLAPGTKVRLDNGGEIPFSEYGVIVHCWRDEQTSLFDCHIAFYGEEMPLGEPDEKPYILRYYASTLATVGIAIDEDADSGVQSPEVAVVALYPI